MLGTLARPEELKGPLVLEVKYDGYRALAALSGGELRLLSRRELDLAGRFPELARALRGLRIEEAVLDGEVVAVDSKGTSRFQLLQTGRGELRYVAFDLLWMDGEDLRHRPLEERRELLESLLSGVPGPLQLSERLNLPLDQALAAARERGLEGVMAKRLGSTYRGRRSRDWLKLKTRASQEVAILGYLPMSSAANQLGALLVGVREQEGFRYAGRVGTGFSEAARRELKRRLDQHRVARPPWSGAPRLKGAIWVEPGPVAQVAFAEWTRDGLLRQPVFQGLREDKRPEECLRERPWVRGA